VIKQCCVGSQRHGQQVCCFYVLWWNSAVSDHNDMASKCVVFAYCDKTVLYQNTTTWLAYIFLCVATESVLHQTTMMCPANMISLLYQVLH
jgi:hypothetical protein